MLEFYLIGCLVAFGMSVFVLNSVKPWEEEVPYEETEKEKELFKIACYLICLIMCTFSWALISLEFYYMANNKIG